MSLLVSLRGCCLLERIIEPLKILELGEEWKYIKQLRRLCSTVKVHFAVMEIESDIVQQSPEWEKDGKNEEVNVLEDI